MVLLNIFFDNQGNFDWRSITAIVAFIAAILSFLGVLINIGITNKNNKKALNQQKELGKKTLKQQRKINEETLKQQKEINEENFKGNVVAKARIEWIQEVRKKSVEFITDCFILLEFIRNKERNSENEVEFIKLRNEIEKSGHLLILYFGPDKNGNNDYIASFVLSLIRTFKYDYSEAWDEKKVLNEVEGILYSLRDFLRIYLKAEWKRANGEISDVQAYLEKQKLYKKIIDMYSVELKEHYIREDILYKIFDSANKDSRRVPVDVEAITLESEESL